MTQTTIQAIEVKGANYAKMIEIKFSKNFHDVKFLGDSWTGSGTMYFKGQSCLFGDEMEFKLTSDGVLYGRMHLEEFDYDFEMEGVTDEYVTFGTLTVQ